MSVFNTGMNGYNQFQQPQQQRPQAPMGGFGGFMQSPGGSALISGIMGGIGAVGQGQRDERMNQQDIGLQREMLAQRQREGSMDDRLQRDMGYVNQAPTGWEQNYQQQTLLKNMMLQKLMNGTGLTPTNPGVAAKLGAQGPAFKPTIPEEWQGVNPFGVDQTMQALGNRQGALDMLSQGQGPGIDFTKLGYDPEKAAQLNQRTQDFRQFQGQQAGPQMGPQGMSPQLGEAINMQRKPSVMGGAMSGAMTGASMGSIVPGLGTAIGGGIGALVGAGKAMGGPRLDSYGQDFVNQGGTPEQYKANLLEQFKAANGQLKGGFNGIRAMLQGAAQGPMRQTMQQPQMQNPYMRF